MDLLEAPGVPMVVARDLTDARVRSLNSGNVRRCQSSGASVGHIGRDEFTATYDQKPLAAPTFAAGIDTVGGPILSGILKATQYDGVVTCCGLVASAELTTSIFPFILRGVHLAGIDSIQAPMAVRQEVWQQLATAWKPANLDAMVQEMSLPDVPAKLDELLHGQAKGRYVVAHA